MNINIYHLCFKYKLNNTAYYSSKIKTHRNLMLLEGMIVCLYGSIL